MSLTDWNRGPQLALGRQGTWVRWASKHQNPEVRLSIAIGGKNIVVAYTKHQSPHE
jgi:hypothetical protein